MMLTITYHYPPKKEHCPSHGRFRANIPRHAAWRTGFCFLCNYINFLGRPATLCVRTYAGGRRYVENWFRMGR